MTDPQLILKRFAEICDAYDMHWPTHPDSWRIAGTCGLTVGDLRAAKAAYQATLPKEGNEEKKDEL